MACPKRRYDSEKHAKRANRNAGFRLRAYWCQECRAYHVTNAEKRHHAERWNDR